MRRLVMSRTGLMVKTQAARRRSTELRMRPLMRPKEAPRRPPHTVVLRLWISSWLLRGMITQSWSTAEVREIADRLQCILGEDEGSALQALEAAEDRQHIFSS